MKTVGRVVRRSGTTAWVRVCHGEFCGGCGHHSPDDQLAEIEAHDPLGVRVGEKVEVASDTGRMLRAMVLVFWVPLIVAGLGAWAGSELAPAIGLAPGLGAALCGIVGLVAAGVVVRNFDRKSAPGAGVTVVRVVEAAPCRSLPMVEG